MPVGEFLRIEFVCPVAYHHRANQTRTFFIRPSYEHSPHIIPIMSHKQSDAESEGNRRRARESEGVRRQCVQHAPVPHAVIPNEIHRNADRQSTATRPPPSPPFSA